MASAALRDELSCSICLSLYTEPVSLRCGHHFCRSCIGTALDTQEGSGVYSCPECREEYQERPLLEKNRKLCNIVERLQSTHQNKIFCTFCLDSPLPALKSCLHCETSMCERHLLAHNKSVAHDIIEPTSSFEERKCSAHKEMLKYYCPAEGVCICMSCWVAGDHQGHQVELLDKAAEKKKEDLRDFATQLSSRRHETDNRIRNLESHKQQEKGKAADVTKRVKELFSDLRRQLDDVEKNILTEILRQEKNMSQSTSDLIQQLEQQKDEMSEKLKQIEELSTVKDSLTVLMKELPSDDIIQKSDDITSDIRDAGCLDERMILQMLHSGLLYFTDSLIDMKIKRQFPTVEKSDISLDINTAGNYIIISEDRQTASHAETTQNRPEGPERFLCAQVLSAQSFSSGRHYWEVDVRGAEQWLIGVAAHSIERKTEGNASYIGYNEKSWALDLRSEIGARHNNDYKKVSKKCPIKTVGIYLDYEAGRLSFYQLCGPIRHLHTFTATFTEPLHAALYVFSKTYIRIIA